MTKKEKKRKKKRLILRVSYRKFRRRKVTKYFANEDKIRHIKLYTTKPIFKRYSEATLTKIKMLTII